MGVSGRVDGRLVHLGNVELMGHYIYDDEGVKAHRVTVVDKGILKTFLVDRAPTRDFVFLIPFAIAPTRPRSRV